MSTYVFQTSLPIDLDSAISIISEELGSEGFGVLSTIDIQAAFKAKLGADVPPYTILGACNPVLSQRVLEVDNDLGALLPCNVVVRAADDGVDVVFVDPLAAMSVVDDPEVAAIAQEARTRLLIVRDRLAQRADQLRTIP